MLRVALPTSSGVHAQGQVVTYQPQTTPFNGNWSRTAFALNRLLPEEIRVWFVGPAPNEGFDPAESLQEVTYCYHVMMGQVPDPTHRLYNWQYQSHQQPAATRLDMNAMRSLATQLAQDSAGGLVRISIDEQDVPSPLFADGYHRYTFSFTLHRPWVTEDELLVLVRRLVERGDGISANSQEAPSPPPPPKGGLTLDKLQFEGGLEFCREVAWQGEGMAEGGGPCDIRPLGASGDSGTHVITPEVP